MADHSVTLVISERLLKTARQLAAATAQPLEDVLRQYLENSLALAPLPSDQKAELHALRSLSDDTLWTIAAEQMPALAQARRSTLLALNARDVISEAELAELDELLARGDRLMLRKAEAVAILTARGHHIVSEDLAAPHE
jgi:hypothetical protein